PSIIHSHPLSSPSNTTPPYTLSFLYTPTATTHIYTLSLHDALPISIHDGNTDAHANSNSYSDDYAIAHFNTDSDCYTNVNGVAVDRKSTRLNSSHVAISYAVFCLKKKKNNKI